MFSPQIIPNTNLLNAISLCNIIREHFAKKDPKKVKEHILVGRVEVQNSFNIKRNATYISNQLVKQNILIKVLFDSLIYNLRITRLFYIIFQ